VAGLGCSKLTTGHHHLVASKASCLACHAFSTSVWLALIAPILPISTGCDWVGSCQTLAACIISAAGATSGITSCALA